MAKVKNFAICAAVYNVNERDDILGVMSAIQPEHIPGSFDFSVHFTILDFPVGRHSLGMNLKAPDESVVMHVENSDIIYDLDPNSNLPSEYQGLNVGINLKNVDVGVSGLYYVDVLLDQKILESFEVFVMERGERK